jgi:hypothetical protein
MKLGLIPNQPTNDTDKNGISGSYKYAECPSDLG